MPRLFQPELTHLSNGIPVVLQHYDGPVASTYWWVQTGSADEGKGEEGFAHFLEHMLFKDASAKETGSASIGQTAQAIESMGGDINAYTSFDQTVYHVTCAAQHWEKVIDSFGIMAKPQKFLKADFDREREVILEELKKNEDSPGRQLFQSLFGATFKKHPYGRPVIGFTKTLKAATVSKLEAFYRRNYVSGKMGLILVGPMNDARKKTILKYLEKHLGRSVLPKKVAVKKDRPLEPELRSSVTCLTRGFDVKTPTISFSFRVPDLRHPDIPALDLLSGILGMGELSRVYQKLFYQSAIATEVSGGMYVPYDSGMLYFQAELDSTSKVNSAAELLLKEFQRIRDEGPTEEELARVIASAESERLYATQTADGMAGRLGFLKFVIGDLEFDQKYLEELRSVDSTRIQEVARQYLDYRRMNAVVLVPRAEANFDMTEVGEMAKKILVPAQEVTRGIAVPKKQKSGTSLELPVQFFKLPSGIQVAYFERPQSHVFSVHASVLGGARLEIARPVDSPQTDWGSSYMMSLTWTKGTSKKSARDVAAIIEGRAAGMDGFSGRNTTGLQLTGLARDWTNLSSLFTEVLVDPSFAQEEVDHSRRVAEDSVRSIEDHSAQLATKLFLENLFESHPYGRLTIGSMESLPLITPEKLRAFHRRWMRPERLVLSISGAVKKAHLEIWLADLESQMDARIRSITETVGEFPITLPEEPPLKAPRWIEKNLGREQTHILVGGYGTHVYSDDRHAIRLLQTLLGGQSGRLFIELREKKSLAYTVSPMSFEGIEKGYAGTYIACSPSKKDEALAGIQKVLQDLADKGPTQKEMSRAKEFFLGRRAMDLQGDSSLAAHYGLERVYGIPHLSEEELAKKIRSISAKEIREVCRKYLVEPFMVTSIVG